MTKYPNSGTLGDNRKKGQNAKAPDLNGKLTLTKEVIEGLMQAARQTGEGTLYLSAWRKDGPTGAFLSVSAQLPMQQQGGGANYGGGSSSGKRGNDIPF